MTRKDLLSELLVQANHNLFCYSGDYMMSKPRDGYEKEFAKAKEKVKLLFEMFKENGGEE